MTPEPDKYRDAGVTFYQEIQIFLNGDFLE